MRNKSNDYKKIPPEMVTAIQQAFASCCQSQDRAEDVSLSEVPALIEQGRDQSTAKGGA